ncbi:Hypothetical predicted protein, partial [Scomber scombrus]
CRGQEKDHSSSINKLPGPPASLPTNKKPSHFTVHYLELPRREAGPASEAREGRTALR